MFEALSLLRPPQLVVGTVGTIGKKPEKPGVINNAQVTDASILKRFAYIHPPLAFHHSKFSLNACEMVHNLRKKAVLIGGRLQAY
jgi:hypothetical protein